MREKNYEYAIKVLTKMSELRPKNSVVVRDIGECHYRLHHNDDALKYLTRSIEISKYDWWALNLRYHVYLELGEYKKALLDCQKCIQLKPSFVAAQRDLITLCSKLPRDKDAKLILSKLNEFEPVTAARALMGNSNFRGAIDILTAGLKTANTPALKVRILEQRKKCFFNLGDHANSLADLNEIIRLEPSAKAYVFLQRANEERALKNYSASAKDLTTVINMHPTAKQIHLTLDELYYRRAFCYIEMKEFQKAIADLDTLLKIDPAQEEAHKLRGECNANLGRFQLALDDLGKAIKFDQESSGSSYFARSLVYQKMGKTKEAEADKKRAQELGYVPRVGRFAGGN